MDSQGDTGAESEVYFCIRASSTKVNRRMQHRTSTLLTSQVGILTNQVKALKQFLEGYNKRVNVRAIKRLCSVAEAIDIKVDLETKKTMLLTQGEIIDTDSTVKNE